MEALQQQIIELQQQIKSLSQIIESLPEKMVATIASYNLNNDNILEGKSNGNLEHKDVLVDKNQQSWLSHVDGHEISSEWQVRRLTAQLTTAYNRIAALEEELINRRMNLR